MQYVKHFSIWEVKAKLPMLSGTQSQSQELNLQAWSLVRTVSRHFPGLVKWFICTCG